MTRSGRRAAVALALATGAASTGLLGLAGPALAQAPTALDVPATVTDEDAQEGAVAAIRLGVDGRPTFVEVVAPTVEQAVRRATSVPGSDGVAFDTPVTAFATTDPYRSQQWSLDALGVSGLPAGSASSLVAVVDTGVRATHEDFAPGQVRCDLGADFTAEALGACADPGGHGTHVAGVVGAVSGNGKGVASIAPGTSILPVRVLDRRGAGSSLDVARGIVHAADRGAAVINLSLGGPDTSTALDAAVKYATSAGAVVVAAAGNNREEGNQVNYPAASPGALSVASTDRGGTSSSFSYSGPTVDIAAPGGGIASLWGTGDRAYAVASGTSMAAPAVSAVAALYRAANPSATPAQVAAALIGTATDLERAGWDHSTGAGLLNPAALLGQAAPSPQPAVTVPTPRVHVVTPRLARKRPLLVRLTDYRPASTVTLYEEYRSTAPVSVPVSGSTAWPTSTTTKTVVLGTFRVAANGTVSARVVPVQSARTGTLLVRGVDRAARPVQTEAAIRYR